MNPISVRAQYMKNLLSALSKQTHVTKSIFGSIYFPYLLQLLVDKKIDLREFSNISKLDEKSGEALTKEMDLIMGKRNE
jgi:hypothetical protein